MNWDELIAVVKEAGFDWSALGIRDRLCFEKLVALVAEKAAAQEREACAQVGMLVATNGIEVSAAIRARGQKGVTR